MKVDDRELFALQAAPERDRARHIMTRSTPIERAHTNARRAKLVGHGPVATEKPHSHVVPARGDCLCKRSHHAADAGSLRVRGGQDV
jgi:hypothetical protein